MVEEWSVVRMEDASAEGFPLEGQLGSGLTGIAGVDEVGRGCLAGPVFAAAVALTDDPVLWRELDDSKRLSKKRRVGLYETIIQHAAGVSIGQASVAEIDSLNILHASRLAMARALAGLDVHIECILVDGTFPPTYVPTGTMRVVPVVDGDARCPSISAASIVAKVERDRYMESLAQTYPVYQFEQNAGYGTRAHLQALTTYGPCAEHRTSFGPVASLRQSRLMIDG
jgi:ribonuclease HII